MTFSSHSIHTPMVASLAFLAVPLLTGADPLTDPCVPTTKTGGTLVLGDGKALSDTVELGRLCSFPGTLTFKVSGDAIFVPKEFTQNITEMGSFSQTGPVPPDAGTFTWIVTYTPKNGTPSTPVSEKQDVTKTPEPSTSTLMLLGIVFLLVMWKRRVAHSRTP